MLKTFVRNIKENKKLNKQRKANKKYYSCRNFIFIENDLVNLKIPDTKTLIE